MDASRALSFTASNAPRLAHGTPADLAIQWFFEYVLEWVYVCVCVYRDLNTATSGGVFCFIRFVVLAVLVLFDYLSALVVRDHLPVVQAR
jgi:hypothetical protein